MTNTSYDEFKIHIERLFTLIGKEPTTNLTEFSNNIPALKSYIENISDGSAHMNKLINSIDNLDNKVDNFLSRNISDRLEDFFNFFYEKNLDCLDFFKSINLNLNEHSGEELLQICEDYRSGNYTVPIEKSFFSTNFSDGHLIIFIFAVLFFLVALVAIIKSIMWFRRKRKGEVVQEIEF